MKLFCKINKNYVNETINVINHLITEEYGINNSLLKKNINEVKTIILTESQANNVKSLIFEQYLIEATLDDIYTKYYSNIPQDEFWQIIKADPTYNEQKSQKMGKYGKWLLNLYKQVDILPRINSMGFLAQT